MGRESSNIQYGNNAMGLGWGVGGGGGGESSLNFDRLLLRDELQV